jgi:hypothetical protein
VQIIAKVSQNNSVNSCQRSTKQIALWSLNLEHCKDRLFVCSEKAQSQKTLNLELSMNYLSAPTNEGLPRKLTAIGTVGSLNQLFTVYEKNWNCTDCGQENYASR